MHAFLHANFLLQPSPDLLLSLVGAFLDDVERLLDGSRQVQAAVSETRLADLFDRVGDARRDDHAPGQIDGRSEATPTTMFPRTGSGASSKAVYGDAFCWGKAPALATPDYRHMNLEVEDAMSLTLVRFARGLHPWREAEANSGTDVMVGWTRMERRKEKRGPL